MASENNKNTCYVFVDAANVWSVMKSKRRLIDYGKLKGYIKNKFGFDNVEVFYYECYPEEATREYDTTKKHNFFVFLKKGLGFQVKKKPLKRIRAIGHAGEYIIEKGNMDVEITIDVLHHIDKYGAAILFTGDCDFLPLINYVRNKNKKVYVFSSEGNVSTELRTGSNGYFDMKDEEKMWGPELSHRASEKK